MAVISDNRVNNWLKIAKRNDNAEKRFFSTAPLKRVLVEAKVLVDRWGFQSNSVIVSPSNIATFSNVVKDFGSLYASNSLNDNEGLMICLDVDGEITDERQVCLFPILIKSDGGG